LFQNYAVTAHKLYQVSDFLQGLTAAAKYALILMHANARIVEVAGNSNSPSGWDPRTWGLHQGLTSSANIAKCGFADITFWSSFGQNFSPKGKLAYA
jgi:hypothetical protein